jgi:hypothetical protein
MLINAADDCSTSRIHADGVVHFGDHEVDAFQARGPFARCGCNLGHNLRDFLYRLEDVVHRRAGAVDQFAAG